MRIRKGDNVKVTAGKDRGKTGKVMQAFPALGKVVVEGANTLTKHMKVHKQGEKGQKISYNAPFNATNVQLICPKCAQPTRIGMQTLENEGKTKKVRTCRKCKEAIE
ncbi:50S ribosomal protein L24 [Candidatus Uhrbacteria bacterium CG_4_10_14_0_8_um_filter_58_22]|uniref:Large ribosomal subunit protein uL24 n=1 Tax=Candidatus Uhrbacteria bacterium CG_4_10_14_0_8_um_filter_58_22 TaxID=1975029 RepID=A0A2M7Q9J1_9BACT|nr:MAG: 50S ribosomal protein L24 [Parcubacteria group bacterium CG1_02_58_44]PIY62394.1 MAG: 50S ribosomal protein L24 [Candidatus Uhrbacteria bacterium CG_4_10_14_0_8_um_filter_58_22]